MKHLRKFNEASIFGIEVDDKLMNLANKIAKHLNSIGFNIVTAQGVIIGKRNIISLNQYFSNDYNSGIKLNFDISNNLIKYSGMGKFGFRDKKYETPENLNIIKEIVYEVENYKL